MPGVDGGELVRAQFLAFYDAAIGPLFGYLYRASGGQRELAEDLCQDVFATVLTRVRGGDVSVLTLPWVITVGRNRLIDQWRRSARQERRLSQLSTNQPVATASVNDDVLAWIARLPESQRAAVVLHYLDDLPVHEVAAQLGKSYKSTESLLSRARQNLRASGGVIMSDDRQLVHRLAAIDATPRARWVAELRAALDAAWETGDSGGLDSGRTTTVTLVDNEPTPFEPNKGRRWVRPIVAAAVLLAVFVLVVIARNDGPPADQPSPTVTVPPTAAARRLPTTLDQQIAPGTYYVDEVSGTPTPRIFATIGAGWRNRSTSPGWELAKGGPWLGAARFDEYLQRDLGFMSFSNPVAVYADACHWEDGYHPGPVDTLEGLVAALTEQRGWADVTAPSSISVDGYVGKAFRRTAPTDMSDCATRSTRTRVMSPSEPLAINPDFRSWDTASDGGAWYFEPGEIETLWVVDVDGTLVVISTGVWPEPSAGADPDFATDVLDSIRINPRPLPTVPRAGPR